LAERVVSGVGQRVDLSQFEGSVAMIAPLVLSSAVNKTSPRRLGNRSPSVAPQGVYRCAGSDEWCAISVQNDGQWQAMVAAMGNPAWGTDPRFTTILGRLRHHDEIDGYIEAWTKQLPNTEVERRLKAVGVPAERMRRIQDLIDAHDGTEVFKKMEEPEVGSMLTTWLPFTLSLSQFSPPRPAPSLGGNTREVLESWLDLSEGEIDELKTQGVLV